MFTNAVVKAGAFSASAAYCIIQSIQNTIARQDLYAAIFSHLPQMYPQVPFPPAPYPTLASMFFALLRENAYWFTSLVFSLPALSIALSVKQKIRDRKDDHRDVPQRHGQSDDKQPEFSDEHIEGWFMFMATDSMYRLFQVSLAMLILGHVNSFLVPVGATLFVPTVICGLYYIFGNLVPIVSERPFLSPSPG